MRRRAAPGVWQHITEAILCSCSELHSRISSANHLIGAAKTKLKKKALKVRIEPAVVFILKRQEDVTVVC